MSRASWTSGHPLDLIPLFRRWRPGVVRDLAYTFILGACFGQFFFALFAYAVPRERWGEQLRADFVIAMAISYAIHGLYVLGGALFSGRLDTMRGGPRVVYHLVIPAIGVFTGYFIGIVLLDPDAARRDIFTPAVVLNFAVISVLVSCGLLCLFLLRERERRDKERMADEQRRTLESERRALTAQLRMLQAQIEPHFLYNTLANAVGLIQPAPERARLLLERLIDYLRATLAASRDSEAPLQREVDTIAAYLELMKLRMGERLRFRIDVDEAAALRPIPPMLLQPVVENAIVHGLEPKIDGGEIVLSANVDPTHLCLAVADTGIGLRMAAPAKPGGGVGLSNLRDRIRTLYGADASLTIMENATGGVTVTMRIPLPADPED